KVHRTAVICNVVVHVTHSFRKKGRRTANTTTPARYSNHFIGHAIDVNLATPNGWCAALCLFDHRNPHAKCFINTLKSIGLRWGGDWRPKADPVHFDDNYNSNRTMWKAKFRVVQDACEDL
uniref:Peptidase M15C domain-containing protein n=1 Tax=Ciona savignyi TaxID=51511 RepID=H2Z7K2_CIOSA